ncbi:DUF2232 domain-containing protein [Prosthecomicrobium pneumaticum]|uniref:DUF2232 domain-containing protein n=1 Tax=Prosthecomicrobium pneumaticum TaxID=81895 RepID=A0A7W9FKT3_9HYPH|nr:DUF2232 domain-containing protein [Prosthecomicrobium pneumaticum]MBB5751498.1 hypothetical protein [Prosthecomicrobium pneumaticum]
MTRRILIGLGAGLASALMFIAPAFVALLAFPLFVLAALPVAIAGIGWGTFAGALAALSAAAILGAAFTPLSGLIFLILFGAPSAWLAHAVGLSRATEDGRTEWFPLSAIFFRATLAAAAAVIVAGLLLGYTPAAVEAAMTEAYQALRSGGAGTEAPDLATVQPLIALNVAMLPVTSGAFTLLSLVLSLWLGGRIIRRFGLLARPWQPLSVASLPPLAAALFALSAVAAAMGGTLGHAAGPVAGALGAAFALSGYGAMHLALTGSALRVGMLLLLYALSLVFLLPILVMAAIGVADALTQFKARRYAALSSHDG